ncbi:MAG: hypothetical protein IKK03_07630 [Lachnospiraceae bacterium]|nr:hypothetical protein [Lachnospiraceae bacterium]
MKKTINLLITLCILFSVAIVPVAASTSAITYSTAKKIIAEEVIFGDNTIDFSTLSSSKTASISINIEGMSVYIDYSRMGETFDDSSVEYVSQDADVAYAWDGRILATGKGTTDIILYLGDEQYTINVTVKDNISNELIEAIELVSRGNSLARISDERQSIIDKASDMVNILWRPTTNLTGWRGNYTFEAGRVYSGIPYSMTVNQCDDIEFQAAMSNNDFYNNYSRTINNITYIMPKYGSDCSGFVSFAWGMNKLGTDTFITYPSIGEYENLQPGDAVVYRVNNEGHIILVLMNFQTPPSGSGYNEPYLACYEQTPYHADLTFHTYADLLADGYKAISKFNN